ncbi:MAG: ABC transporter substrate-binding protein [Candidatus Thorarchaeota archaeon]
MKKLRALALTLAVLGMAFALQPATTNAKVQQDVIKIGALGPLAITPGKDMQDGANLAVKEINEAGGIDVGGTPYDVELIVESTSNPSTGLPDATEGVTGLNKLQDQDNVVASIGLFRTEVTVACMAHMDRPFLGVGSTAPIITPYFWRVGPSNGTQLTRSLIDLYAFGLGAQQGVRKVTIVRENAAWSLAMRGPIAAYLSSGLGGALPFNMTFTADIVIDEGASLDSVTTSLTPVADDVDALMPIFSGPAGRHITRAWASLDMPQYLAGINVEAQSSTHFEETQGAAYGEIELETLPPDIEKTPKTKPFREAFKDEYGELPTYTAFASYDSVYLIKAAIEAADSTAVADIQAELSTIDYQGAAYNIKFTNEPGSQWGVADNGTKVPIPGTPDNITVHDLYTRGTVGVVETKYIQGFYAQWQQGGVKKTIWTTLDETVATRNVTKHIEWPIDHAEHGWEEDTGEGDEIPGFELPMVLLVLGNLAMIVHLQRRKKR